MSKKNRPALSVVPDVAEEDVIDAADSAAPDTTTEETREAPGPITVGQQITHYAALTAQLKRAFHLSETTVTKLIELGLNERFTLIQMGLAGRRANPIIPTEESDGNESPEQE